jgi:hypothetical protein
MDQLTNANLHKPAGRLKHHREPTLENGWHAARF